MKRLDWLTRPPEPWEQPGEHAVAQFLGQRGVKLSAEGGGVAALRGIFGFDELRRLLDEVERAVVSIPCRHRPN